MTAKPTSTPCGVWLHRVEIFKGPKPQGPTA
jgi:hypothetical protein